MTVTPKPGTVEHYELHKPCLAEIQKLRDLLEEIAEECDERADATPEYRPNIWMELLMRIREVVPH